MKLRLLTDNVRRAAAATTAGAVLGASLLAATPAMAKPAAADTINGLDRATVISRAKQWTGSRVPYSQTGYKDGYRRDCSGFIAWAWNLPENFVTFNVPLTSKPITKEELRPGDVLLNTGRNRHIVMFEAWADKAHTKYIVLEQTGQSGVDSAIRREVPYPYRIDGSLYKPYRFESMKRYFKAFPPAARQAVKGYVQVAGANPASKAEVRSGRTGRKYVRQGTGTTAPAPKPVRKASVTPAKPSDVKVDRTKDAKRAERTAEKTERKAIDVDSMDFIGQVLFYAGL